MYRSPLLRLLSPLTLLPMASHCLAETWVVSDTAHPVEVPAGIRLIQLDRLDQLEVSLFENLPKDPAQAQEAFAQIMTAESATAISQAHQDILDAWALRVDKIPAVIVDQQYVVYGDPDLERALATIDQYRMAQR
ncbi:TIGR03757 family integrating conjugative element protein [Pseudomonas asplenii]|uniref:TIGR03757 family integrating conjugative element protein n=1 Tax=Pseudomonas asplenii TaxID=53407 RepID=UPI000376CD7D|nr:TIGR03757 family integrating conjugative element protein [Pseudomonas fuscovaginae]